MTRQQTSEYGISSAGNHVTKGIMSTNIACLVPFSKTVLRNTVQKFAEQKKKTLFSNCILKAKTSTILLFFWDLLFENTNTSFEFFSPNRYLCFSENENRKGKQ